jgi:hypothetical protein
VERFVIKQNIEHYRAMLKITTDLERRAVFEKLLREEAQEIQRRSQKEIMRACIVSGQEERT